MGSSWNTRSVIADSMERVRMTESERSVAHASMEQGEHIADFILGTYAVIVSIVHGAERVVRALTRSKSVG